VLSAGKGKGGRHRRPSMKIPCALRVGKGRQEWGKRDFRRNLVDAYFTGAGKKKGKGGRGRKRIRIGGSEGQKPLLPNSFSTTVVKRNRWGEGEGGGGGGGRLPFGVKQKVPVRESARHSDVCAGRRKRGKGVPRPSTGAVEKQKIKKRREIEGY